MYQNLHATFNMQKSMKLRCLKGTEKDGIVESSWGLYCGQREIKRDTDRKRNLRQRKREEEVKVQTEKEKKKKRVER